MGARPASDALKRFTVLDLTRVRAGPTCVRQLADWGANVIKIELPESMDAGNGLGGARHGPDFLNLHRNKRAMTLNLKDEKGVSLLKRLCRKSDVIVENYRPDVKKRLGIDYEVLSAENPGLIFASISGFGQDGPYAKRPGFDQIAQGMGGVMSITGLPNQGPVRAGIPIADLCAGLFAAQGIMIALLEREVSGKGQWIDTSLLQAQLFMLDFQAARWLVDGEVPKQAGNNHPTSIPTGVFKTKDGYINLGVAGQIIWKRFCDLVGREDLRDHPDYADADSRSRNRETLNVEIETFIKEESTSYWVELLNKNGVPSGPIYNIGEAFEDPQVKHLKMAETVKGHVRGDIQLVAQPMKLSRTPSSMSLPPPDYGEHTDEILLELGLSQEDISVLRTQNVI
ncbi:MAG: formyl-CoA transferase [Rhodospirillaceae bacterium]|nr:formyl-CoA transferase [Rhodospirillaceae bacterium]|tara:strand:- start:284 stop:1477 length:1194 start_codon:yes stop_codon:yes gene_type:complete